MSQYPGPRGHEQSFKYTVEIPNPESEDCTYTVLRWCYSEEEAKEWARVNLAADKDGNINVIEKIPM